MLQSGYMSAETVVVHKEVAVGHAADQHLSNRRQELNQRLRKWGKWFVGGLAVGLAGLGLSLAAPGVGTAVMLVGSGMEAVGAVGIIGNILKGASQKNK